MGALHLRQAVDVAAFIIPHFRITHPRRKPRSPLAPLAPRLRDERGEDAGLAPAATGKAKAAGLKSQDEGQRQTPPDDARRAHHLTHAAMKPNATTTPLVSLAIRHGLAVFAGFLIHHGIATDGSSGSLITGMLTLLFVTLASWLVKLRWNWSPAIKSMLDDNGAQVAQKFIGAVVSQALAAFSGYLATTPEGTFNVQDPEALTLFFANAAASRWKVHQLATGLPRAALMLAACLPLASCLNMTKQDGKIAAERIGLGAADAAILVARMQLAQALNDLEAAQHGGSNGDAKTILMKQLGVMAAQKALDAAERAVARERARLDAKQPINVQPGGVPLAGHWKINPLRGSSNGSTQSMPHHARAVKVLRASAPPSYARSGDERTPSKGQVARAHLSNSATRRLEAPALVKMPSVETAGRPASPATTNNATSSARASRSRPAVPIYAPRIIAALRSAS